MKAKLLAFALVPALLTGCASGGYYADSPGIYDNSYYARGGTDVSVAYYSRGGSYHDSDHHDYRHEDTSSHRSYASNRTETHTNRTTSVAHNEHASHTTSETRSVKTSQHD